MLPRKTSQRALKRPVPQTDAGGQVENTKATDVDNTFTYSGDEMRFGPFLVIALLLLVMWAGGFLMFHMASGLIHLLLLFAVISFVAHLVLGTRPA